MSMVVMCYAVAWDDLLEDPGPAAITEKMQARFPVAPCKG
jgi:hypothetical protein